MFERFTERARHVVVLAQAEARETFAHDYIGTEHLLAALLREGGVGARVLDSLGVELDEVRTWVDDRLGRGPAPPASQIPFTPRAKRALECALTEALQLDHNRIGTEHILLGLASVEDGVAVQILGDLGVRPTRVREATIALLEAHGHGQGRRQLFLHPTSVPAYSDWSWFAGVGPVLRDLGGVVERQLGRPPDSGDLLLAMTAYSTTAARALEAAGLDLAALTPEAIAQARRPDQSDVTELDAAGLAALRARLGLPPV